MKEFNSQNSGSTKQVFGSKSKPTNQVIIVKAKSGQ